MLNGKENSLCGVGWPIRDQLADVEITGGVESKIFIT